ncbi:hypothetical protein SAMN02745121_02363 [Nannocystis exedens]|uniref:Uncharacterized protein n=1 Tax=Nannocystis exedens TaxID=54 RepID=A0A1I1WHJ1_9BACT|nr:hypothetical protein [Nannocystis exedens]PCC67726.1 hypothetical protein NAEX_00734 [Nannocystis exedens]SFD94607.1 hypothetical protein SAMN02745121_02363 [Nannocystis exedens]
MTKHAMFLMALAIAGCGGSKSGDTDTDTGTGTETGTATDIPTGTGTGTETGTETGTGTGTDTGAPTGTGGEQPVQVDESGCLSQCVEDVDAENATLEADCEVCDYDPVQHTCAPIVKCEAVMGEWTIPAGQEACFAVHGDSGAETPSMIDNLSQTCIDAGSNAQIEIVRTGEAPAGTFPAAICTWSTSPATDCPNLG